MTQLATVRELLEVLRPYEKATKEGRAVIDFTLKLERFSFDTPIKNPPKSIEAAVKLTKCTMKDGLVTVG